MNAQNKITTIAPYENANFLPDLETGFSRTRIKLTHYWAIHEHFCHNCGSKIVEEVDLQSFLATKECATCDHVREGI